jgi:2-keto-3-deoxy-6-phosphogluconate aldolase
VTGDVSTTAPPTHDVYDRLQRARLVPALRVADGDRALALADRLLATGLDVLEITTTIRGWDDVVATLRTRNPEAWVGAGTITSAALARRAAEVDRIMPTGGIPHTNAAEWLDAGAFAVGIGSDLTAPGDVAARVRTALDG